MARLLKQHDERNNLSDNNSTLAVRVLDWRREQDSNLFTLGKEAFHANGRSYGLAYACLY
jgi:hypothetical protein